MTINIYPTNTCFDDAVKLLMTCDIADQSGLFICHGIVDPGDNGISSHGWVYDSTTDRCIQIGIIDNKEEIIGCRKKVFYSVMKIKEVSYYTKIQALHYNYRYNSSGPWESKYLSLCLNHKPGMKIKKVYDSVDFSLSKFFKITIFAASNLRLEK